MGSKAKQNSDAGMTWWDGRQDRDREAVLLAGLLDDLQESEGSLDWAIEISGRVVAASEALSAEAASEPSGFSEVQMDSLLAVTTGMDFLTPANGILSSLVASEGLAVISDADLRFELARWLQMLADLDKARIWMETVAGERYYPYLAARVSSRRIFGARWGRPRINDSSARVSELLEDVHFVNLLDDRRTALRDTESSEPHCGASGSASLTFER